MHKINLRGHWTKCEKNSFIRYFYICITKGVELVYNVIETGYLVQELAKRVVLLILKPGTDIGITNLLFNLQSSKSHVHKITMNWFTTSCVQVQNQPACSVETSPSILTYICYKGEVSTEQAEQFCNWARDVFNQIIIMLCEEIELRRLNSKVVIPLSVPGFSTSKTTLLYSKFSNIL